MLEALTILTNHHCPPSAREAIRDAIAEEFPRLHVGFVCGVAEEPDVSAAAFFADSFDLWAFDARCEEQASAPWALRVAPALLGVEAVIPVLTRCQRLMVRSGATSLEAVLQAHRRLHDLGKPLVLADYRHSLDVWQWLFRLGPDPSIPLQCAALFHDVERLASESDERIEHLAEDYQTFKDAHAAEGARIVRDVLRSAGVGSAEAAAAAALVERHERPEGDEEVGLLNDADALSFFSMNSSGYADYFGAEQTRKKVAYTWRRMTPRARAKLSTVRLRSDVREMVATS